MNSYPEIGGVYEHYKGGKYRVYFLAKHSETEEILVIYQSIHFGSFHARPLDNFNDTIQDGTLQVPRFKFLHKE